MILYFICDLPRAEGGRQSGGHILSCFGITKYTDTPQHNNVFTKRDGVPVGSVRKPRILDMCV